MTYQSYAVAVGYNNAAGLTNLETIKPVGDIRYFCVVEGYANYDPGVEKLRLDGLKYYVGWPSTKWIFNILTRKQYEYLRDTFCGGGYTGQVTINTTTDREAYGHFNAIIDIPKLTAQQRHYIVFEDFPITFRKMVGI